uniref:Zinc finger GRF-type domain-containing protein n=1 Tax=Quercus lobata TaxID=97700 RepID=A0A7N2MXM2_QUELO
MDSSSMSSSGSLRKRGPARCFCSERPVVVVSWTPDNPGRRFYGCPNYWVRLQEEREEAAHLPGAVSGDK